MMRARRQDIVDEYVEDGIAAVYTTAGMVVLLSELATSAWTILDDDWTPANRIVAHLIDVHGDPGDSEAERLTEEALESLQEMSLVELDPT